MVQKGARRRGLVVMGAAFGKGASGANGCLCGKPAQACGDGGFWTRGLLGFVFLKLAFGSLVGIGRGGIGSARGDCQA